jgi:hypothetical protein
MVRAQLPELGLFDLADILDNRTTRMEGTARWSVDRAGYIAVQRALDRFGPGVRLGDCFEQRNGIRVAWLVDDLLAGGHLDQLARYITPIRLLMKAVTAMLCEINR